jgi:hypothetical protein
MFLNVIEFLRLFYIFGDLLNYLVEEEGGIYYLLIPDEHLIYLNYFFS